MRPRLISALIKNLKAFPPSSTVANPYQLQDCCDNLSAYLKELCKYPYSGYLLVGEAPGYQGCAITGIPFTNEHVLASNCHPFLKALRPSLNITGTQTDLTSTFVWKDLLARGATPAFWNAFPFHPHGPNLKSDRPPTKSELRSGAALLFDVIRILRPHTVVAVGLKAWWTLGCRFPRVRHPSYGGQSKYAAQIEALGIV